MFRPIQCLETPKSREQQMATLDDLYKLINGLDSDISTETTRATNAESTLTSNLNSEITRAKSAESTLTSSLNSEINRAKSAESTLTSSLNSETTRATNAESTLTSSLNSEITRAKSAESTLTSNLNSEITRAKSAESTNATNLTNHNVSSTAHSDIRSLITTLTTRLNTLVDSDDTTLDQLSEIVAYIKSNRTLIENITTNKVNVTDIIDTLTSTSTNKPLSANQGRVLNNLISELKNSLGKAAYVNTTTTNTITHTGWNSGGSGMNNVPTMNFLSCWNGAFDASNNSNLKYCAKGAFGDIVTKSISDFAAAVHTHNYLPLSGGTLTGKVQLPSSASMYIEGMTISRASIGISTQNSSVGYHPLLSCKTYNGNVWNLGSVQDRFGFYMYKNGRTVNGVDFKAEWDTATGNFTNSGNITAPTFIGNLTGNASTATKTYGTLTNPSNAKTYYIPFHSSASSENKSLLNNNGLQYCTLEGTTGATGIAQLGLGNNVASGTAGNKRGEIYMYGTSSGYTKIVPGYNGTSINTITLPSSSGTLSLDGHSHTKSQISDFPTSLPANGGTSSYANMINGTYTGNGGAQPPSYIASGKVRFNMMNAFEGLSNLPSYADCILMDTYTGNDVPYVTGFGIVKASGNPRAFIAVGAKGNTTTWASQTELITGANIASQSVNYATSAGTANSLSYFQNTSNTNMGQDTCNSNAIGYVTDYSGSALTPNIKDGALYRQVYSTAWAHEIYGDYRSGQIAVRSKENGTWQSWRRILDESNYKSYCTPANIGAAASNHAHNYAGSSSAGGSATSAVKLDSSAGSATQPIYFSSGKPVACTYTLGKSVPSNAVFTDTNTWRPVQNNLTSTSTTDCLSAAQGKALNENKMDRSAKQGLGYFYTIDLSSSSYDANTYYPVTLSNTVGKGFNHIVVDVQLDSGTKPSWSTHNSGFSCYMDILAINSGYGTITPLTICLGYTCSFTYNDENPCGYCQLTHSSTHVVWLRGGGKYRLYTDFNTVPTVRTSEYTITGESVKPGTTKPFNFIYSTIYANVTNAIIAEKADTLDGYHGSSSQAANTYVLRDANGYTYHNYINSNTSNSENPPVSQFIVTNGTDHYYRKASLAHVKSALGLTEITSAEIDEICTIPD